MKTGATFSFATCMVTIVFYSVGFFALKTKLDRIKKSREFGDDIKMTIMHELICSSPQGLIGTRASSCRVCTNFFIMGNESLSPVLIVDPHPLWL